MTEKAKEPPSNLALWDKLGKTDPSHTKSFKRAGGFSGTALKPMWVWKRLTEQFGPFGSGWGCQKPHFELVPAGDELMVYCTVEGWHDTASNSVWGVGGDKVIAMTKNGPRADDEAYKKAFTDALMNAFKFVGAGADIHMGLFDDNKYVQQMEAEFNPPPEKQKPPPLQGPIKTRAEVRQRCGEFVRELHSCADPDQLDALLLAKKELIDQVRDEVEFFWLGDGADFLGMEKEIQAAKRACGIEE